MTKRSAVNRGRIERAMLELVGERGYARVTVAAVLARSGSNRAQFYATFDSKESCLEAAYGAAADALVERLLTGCAGASSWAGAMRGALEQLAEHLAAEPDLVRGALAEARTVGGRVAARREEVIGRLTRAVDRARREVPRSRHAPPSITARFIVSAVEAAVLKCLAEPGAREFGEEVPDLLYLAVDLYLGPDAARSEVRALTAQAERGTRQASDPSR